MKEPVVRMVRITKRFPGIVANDHVNFEVRAGEIHALLGENGAGKTTLMNILYGLLRPDEGEIYIRGRQVVLRSPIDAIKLGIGMVHQHFMLTYPHTVSENVMLGLNPGLSSLKPLRMKDVKEKIVRLSKQYRLKVDPEARIWQLSVGEQQRVEILKVLFREANILILDEPTSVLTPQEAKELFSILRRMAKKGKSIIFITHKLGEALAISDRITVLKDGRNVRTIETSKTNEPELARLMIGERLLELRGKKVEKGEVILRVENLHALDDRGTLALRGVSFSLHRHEILGIAGVAGNGQRELAEAIVGLRKVTAGKIFIEERDVTNSSPKKIIEEGVAYIPEERLQMGIVPNMSVAENLILRNYRYPPFSNILFLNSSFIGRHAERMISEFNIVTPSKDRPAVLLSGGNLQRLILARELYGEPRLIIASHPTRGLDVRSARYVRNRLLEQKEKGAGILLISEDLEEITSLSDRIAIMYRGEIMDMMPTEEASIEKIGLLMAGVRG